MRRRGFTLVELAIVLIIFATTATALSMLAYKGYDWFSALDMNNSLKVESRTAAERIFHLAASNRGYKIDADNHGLSFADGSAARWEGARLEVRHKGQVTLLAQNVKDFSAIKREGVLTLNLVVEAPLRVHGGAVRLHEIYDSGVTPQ